MESIRILIADDHPVVRAGLCAMFSGRQEFQVVAEAADGVQAVALATERHPDVILMDLRMPGLSGIEAVQQILQTQPGAHILILTTYDSDYDINAALNAGARGYLLKDSPREELYQAVQTAARGKSVLGMTISSRLLEQRQTPDNTLTEREIAVLALAAQGNTNKVIGKKLHISEATVKTHLKHIYARLEVADRAAAVAVALERHIIRLER
jgi:DNA-binding NarL/FixJ family response regulator